LYAWNSFEKILMEFVRVRDVFTNECRKDYYNDFNVKFERKDC